MMLPKSFGDLQRQVERAFQDFSKDWDLPEFFNRRSDEGFMPDVEMHENDKQIKLSAELPGMDEKDIKVELSDQMLTISGTKKSETESKEGDYFRSERRYGSFSRSMSLPFAASENAVNAEFKKGVLTVTIDKPEEVQSKTKKIPVKGSKQ